MNVFDMNVSKGKGRLQMKLRIVVLSVLMSGTLAALACGGEPETANTATGGSTGGSTNSQPATPQGPSALPDNGFRAQLTFAAPPAKLRAGQKETIQVRVKNASDVMWYARGAAVNTGTSNKFYLAAGNRWFDAAGEKLVTDMDGRYGIPKDLKPGEEVEIPLVVTAPKAPGEYTLDVDLVQEQVAWFHEKGSPTARTKITVAR